MDTDLIGVNRVVAEFCGAVVAEPLCFFSEADLQSLLFARLVKAFPKTLETSVERGPGSTGKYRTGRVHREYGAGGGQRIDLCVFSEAAIKSIDRPTLMAQGRYLKPDVVIELGTEKTVDAASHIASDLLKLARAHTRGYLIHFVRDSAVADTGTARRLATERRLDQGFKSAVSAIAAPQNVVYLCFLLRIRRARKRIWGKCEFHGSGDRGWSKINTAGVAGKVLGVLERA